MQDLTIRRPNLLHQEVADAIRRAILSGQLKPGARLHEVELSERLEVSRAPLREALRLLEEEGLVVSSPHRGSVVAQLTPDDVHEIYSLRQALEELAVAIIVKSVTPKKINQLRALLREMDAAVAEGDLSAVVDLDMRCHETIMRMSGHSRLYAAWKRMEGQLRLFFAEADQLIEYDHLGTRHQHLIDAIASGDEATAIAAVREHIGHAADLLLTRDPEGPAHER